ncbi:hypothetical protein CANCADRAFT_56317 [Tortispora caseinolytica NRRL Y-17796]|uniref:Ribosomal RNA-processing protein 41 n=1 Tax=Tortispora caseinolytica NRRL Y-17796 TaxID=767744 RepID=A0A1E4TM41_9ASCO|nr:hypothetical protein CANCADRAFT_56317 [Tortispora caseinolytica NRRL Y-17796]
MSRIEIFNSEGFRHDGRRFDELRNFTCTIGDHPNLDGSSSVKLGATKVSCMVVGPYNGPPRLNFSIDVTPFSTFERQARKNEKRLQELQSLLVTSFTSACATAELPGTIDVRIQVLAQDGGLVSACTNAATLALIDAGIPMKDYICACSAGIYDTTPFLDLSNAEETDLSFLTIGALGNDSDVLMLLLENKIPADHLPVVMDMALSGTQLVRQVMDDTVRYYTQQRLAKRKLTGL